MIRTPEMVRRRGRSFCGAALLRLIFALAALHVAMPMPAAAQTELGSEDDLTVLGSNGTNDDPDAEIKGFTVFGSTQAAYTGAAAAPGNVVVNGVLAVSSGAYFVGNSTFPAASKIFVNDGAAGQVLRKGAAGALSWDNVSALGDNLGNHNATQRLNMAANPVIGVSSLTIIAPDAYTSSLWVSTSVSTPHLYVSTSGNVGIFTSTPAALLSIDKSDSSVPLLYVGGEASFGSSAGRGVIMAPTVSGSQNGLAAVSMSPVLKMTGSMAIAYGNVIRTTLDGSGGTALTDFYSNFMRSDSSATYTGTLANLTTLGIGPALKLEGNKPTNTYGITVERQGVSGITNVYGTYITNQGIAGVANSYGLYVAPQVGSTNNYAAILGGNVGISTGAPQARLDVLAGGSTAADMATIWRNSAGTIVSSVSATGVIMASKFIGDASEMTGTGDNLGSHEASQRLNMLSYPVIGVSSLTIIAPDNYVSSLWISTNAAVPHLYVSTSGAVGIGTADPFAKFSVEDSRVNNTDASLRIGAFFRNTNTASSNGTYYSRGLFSVSRPVVKTGITDSGASYGIIAQTLRNLAPEGDDDSGTLSKMYGLQLGFGHHGLYPAQSPVTTNAYGLYIAPYLRTGSVSNMYDLYIEGSSYFGGTGSAANHYGVYQADGKIRNYLAANTGIGGAPAYRLHVSSGAGEAGDIVVITTGTSNVIRMTGAGEIYAGKFIGDGSELTNIPGHLSGGETPKLAYWTSDTTLGNSALSQDSAASLTAVNSTFTVQGNAFSVGGSTLAVKEGNIGVGTPTPKAKLHITGEYGNYGPVFPFTNGGLVTSVGAASDAGLYGLTMASGGKNAASNLGWFSNIFGVNTYYDQASDTFKRYATSGGFVNAQAISMNSDSGQVGGNRISFWTGANSDPSERMSISAAGNVGISTNAPEGRLDIKAAGSTAADMATIWRNSAGTIVSSVSATGVIMASKFIGDASEMTGTGDNLGSHNATQRLNMAANPVIGVSSLTIIAPDTYASALWVSTSSSAPILYVSTAGSVGVGTLPGSTRLNVAGTIKSASSGHSWIISESGQDYDATFQLREGPLPKWDIYNKGNDGDTLNIMERSTNGRVLTIQQSGNVGISTNAPEGRLDIRAAGDVPSDMATIWRNSAGTIVSSVSATGVMMASKFIGDGSGMTGVGDNLGDHAATMTIAADYGIAASTITASTASFSGYVNASAYQINGSTVVAVLPGSYSIAYGVNAGTSSTTGTFNTFVGGRAGESNTTGQGNFAGGFKALDSNPSGTNNTAVGGRALAASITGSNNTAVGAYALYANVGSQNVAVGLRGALAASTFSSSTIVGANAGLALTSGVDNTFLGWQAGYNVTTGTRNILIGYDVRTPAANTNNFLNVGNLIYGDLSGKMVGISTNGPQAALDIKSAGATPADMATIWRNSAGTIVSSVSATGVMMASKFIGDGSGITGVTGATDDTKVLKAGDTMTGPLTLNGSSLTVVMSGTYLGEFRQSAISGADAFVKIRGSRNGSTASDIAALDLSDYDNDEAGGTEFVMARVSGGMNNASGQTGYLRFYTNSGASLTEKMRIDKDGNVGMGVTAPTNKLELASTGGSSMQFDTSVAGKVTLKIGGVAVAELLP